MIFPYFLLDFKDKKEYIKCNYFRIAPFTYKANRMVHFEEIKTSDNFKNKNDDDNILLIVFISIS